MSSLFSNNIESETNTNHRNKSLEESEDFASFITRWITNRNHNFTGDMGNKMSENLSKGDMATHSSESRDFNLSNQDSGVQKPHLSSTIATTTTTATLPQQPQPRRNCRAPISRKFAHPCGCSGQTTSSFIYHHTRQPRVNNSSTSNGTDLPAIANSSPMYLYEPNSKKCLPTSRQRDMLLRDCHIVPSLNQAASAPTIMAPASISDNIVVSNLNLSTYAKSSSSKQQAQLGNCYYNDLTCDTRRHRCVCKPNYLLLFDHSSSSFGCVPIENTLTSSPDKTINCKPGSIYNVISKDCQRLFDVSELPPSHAVGPYVNQFSFLTIVLIWILLLLIILIAKLKRIRAKNLFRASQSTTLSGERRSDYSHSHGHRHHHHSSSIGHHGSRQSHGYNRGQNQHSIPSSWFHPFIAAVNGHHHMNHHRGNLDRDSRRSIDESGNYNDTDFFLANGTRRFGEILTDGNLVGSQISLNNPPPKFEEIYPSCPPDAQLSQHFLDSQQQQLQQPQQLQQQTLPPPSNEDLPTYDEAMKLQNTKPPDLK